MTIASSTTKPVAMVSAISDRLSIEKPAKYMVAKVATIESGRPTPAMTVARHVPRKNRTTSVTRPIAMTSVISTSWIEAWIMSVRSDTIESFAPAGSACDRRGSSARMRLTVSTTLAPGWRCTSNTTAGTPLYQAPTLAFSSPSEISATSLSRIGAPFR